MQVCAVVFVYMIYWFASNGWLQTVGAKPHFQICYNMDAVAFRRQLQYEPHTQTTTDFVDLGDGTDETSAASQALVFMVVGLQGLWKTPIACFFFRTFTPDIQKALLQHAFMTEVSQYCVCDGGWVIIQHHHVHALLSMWLYERSQLMLKHLPDVPPTKNCFVLFFIHFFSAFIF